MNAQNADPLFSVAGQTVLVSGGTRGIGRAIAEGFAVRGARVTITGRDETAAAAVAAEIGHGVTGRGCDVGNSAAIRAFVEEFAAGSGVPDTLINVAGVNRRKPALEVTEDDYDFILDTNLKGAFVLAQHVGAGMARRGSGSVINVTSLNTIRPLKNVTPYAMSKAAMLQMTRALAVEWGARGVRVNALAPGFILTDLTKKLWSDPGMQAWGRANTPLERLGKPADMIGTAVFLAAPASGFLTGQEIVVDGGFTAGWAWPIPGDGGQ